MHAFRRLSEELLEVTRRLPDAVLVLHERDADEALAVLAEAEAGRDGEIGFLDEQLCELD
jgi:hypothetical protein